ncbi:MAG: RluA family pseudouridine synthase [Planctomycetes bacterium]|nr:RluA family pseudouridine synthase [Planctomycetota bacterium]
MRLDAFLAREFPDRSRARLQRSISAGSVLVDGARAKPAARLRPGQLITLALPELPRECPAAEPVPIDILYEDACLVAVNKPPSMVVHPSRGHLGGTLANALAHHFAALSGIGGPTRPGIVHRLDRDTSGVIIVAKDDATHLALASQWEHRTIEKEYLAVVAGVPDRDRDRIEQPIGIHPRQRDKMAIRAHHATTRTASTFFEVTERFEGFAVLRVEPKTGRTHQIRVHLAHLGCPVLCDRLYGGRARITVGDIRRSDDATVVLDRQALHACRLRLKHPLHGTPLELTAPLPPDLTRLIAALRQWRAVPA